MTFYTYRESTPNMVHIAKFEEDRSAPVEVYTIFGTKCSCFGAVRNPYCKHRKIQDVFKGVKGAGFGYDADHEKWIRLVPEVDWNTVDLTEFAQSLHMGAS